MNIINFVIYFCAQFISIYYLIKCYGHISYKDVKLKSEKRLYLFIAISSLLFATNNLYNINEYKILVSFIIEFLTFKLYFKDNLKETMIKTTLIVLITTAIELILSLLLMINSSLISSINILVKSIFSIIVFKLADIIISRDKILIGINRIIKFTKSIIFFETIILILVVINIMLLFRSSYFGNKYTLFAIIILVLFVIFTFSQIMKSKFAIEKLKAKNKELTNSYKASSAAMEQFRELKHNLKNDLFSIKSFLPKEKQILLNNLMSKYNSKYDWLNNVTDIPEGLQGIIYLKKLEAEKQKVKLNVNYNSTKDIKEKDFIDLCDALGIFLDNAIEASKENGNKTVVLDIRDYYDSMLLKVINKFSNNVDINEIGNKDYSTKNRNSGLGLNYIRKIKNKNIKTKIQIVNNLFIANIEYKTKEK